MLGQTIVVVNQPGASGVDRHQERAGTPPRDGYTWTAGAAQDLGTYQTLGSLNAEHQGLEPVSHRRQHPGDRRQSERRRTRTPKQLLDAMKAKPGRFRVATAGVTSAGHNAMELIVEGDRRHASPRHLRRRQPGGRRHRRRRGRGDDAARRRAGRHDPRQAPAARWRRSATRRSSSKATASIPPLSATLPGFTAPANYFGIFIPKGVPDDVVKTVEKIWAENIAKSEAIKKYATSRGAPVRPRRRRGGAEGGVPGGAGQRLAALQRRQGQGLAGHGRHSQALSGDRASDDDDGTEGHERPRSAPSPAELAWPRAASDLRDALGWLAVRHRRSSIGSIRMDRLEAQHINPYTVPGLLPGLLGLVMILLGVLLALRSWGRGARLVGGPRLAVDWRLDAPARRRDRPDPRSTPSCSSAAACRSGSSRRSTSPPRSCCCRRRSAPRRARARLARPRLRGGRVGIGSGVVIQYVVPGRVFLVTPSLVHGSPHRCSAGLADLAHAWLGFMNPTSIGLGLGGALLGIIVGILPGLSATLVIALLTTITIKLPANNAILVLICSYVGALYGGSRTAILLNIPGTAANAASCADGYALAQRGEAGRAIGIATSGALHRHAVRRALPGRVHAVARRGRARLRRLRVLLARALRRRDVGHRSSATIRSRAG